METSTRKSLGTASILLSTPKMQAGDQLVLREAVREETQHRHPLPEEVGSEVIPTRGCSLQPLTSGGCSPFSLKRCAISQ